MFHYKLEYALRVVGSTNTTIRNYQPRFIDLMPKRGAILSKAACRRRASQNAGRGASTTNGGG